MKCRVLLLSLFAAAGVQALETIPVEELVTHCQSDAPGEVAVCRAYINGFLDGAYATDPSVAETVLAEMGREESFSERAIRTRLGRSIERFGPSYYAGFCIPGDVPMETLVAELRRAVLQAAEPPRGQAAREYLYQLLKAEHPCPQGN